MKTTLEPRRDALLLVDVQPDFMPGGALPVAEGDPIVAPQDWHPRGHVSFASSHGRRPYEVILLGARQGEQTLWPDHCVQGTAGAALHAGLPLERVSLILRKGTRREVDSYSGFRENLDPEGRRAPTGLAGWLRERGIG